ncbi:NRDE family protein [Sediminitomix flava]|uniref:Transport and Golgi organization protein 2 n=1 Tax=Sediminitomix flava TaxID=379075 RepID=A0A315ZCC4_SEDFL|nr:NRDE family protein [Sediminitomix flava]PWJ42970.1 transport and Golgi organization protein 2 [Sediminitomix flava]
MCTVTYLPYKDGFILTSNRDESIIRPKALTPAIESYKSEQLLFPKDPKGLGSWIGYSDHWDAVVLLNGGHQGHIPNPPYRQSRGLVVLDLLCNPHIKKFISSYNFQDIEPFTIVAIRKNELYSFVWDSKKISFNQLESNSHYIWSSSTLYKEDIRLKRQIWFQEWHTEQNGFYELDQIRDFHHFGGEGHHSEVLKMEKTEIQLKTVSITSILKTENQHFMLYEDLLSNAKYEAKLHESVQLIEV